MELSTLDYWYLVREWQSMIGGRIQKIYLKDRMHVLQVYHKQLEQKQLTQWVLTDGAGFFSSAKITFPQTPSGYCAFLRKRVQGFRIQHIELLGFDRIVKITLETKEGPLEFIIELFDDLNSMVVKDGKIISALASKTYSERAIRGGQPYLPPPSKPAPWDADLNLLIGKPAGKALATDLGLGGKYSDEVCARAGFDKKKVLAEEDLDILRGTLLALRDEPLAPRYNDTEALPFTFTSKQGNWTSTATFNEAVDTVTRIGLETHEQQGIAAQTKQRQTKQQKIIAAQEAQLEKNEQITLENQRAGEAIYEHYSELKELLEAIKADWKHKTFKEIQEQYGTRPYVKAINPDGTIDLELP